MPVPAGVEAAFATYRIVALVDPRTPAVNRVVLSLVRDRAFRSRARVIVYDCCARRFQALVDRYVSGGAVAFEAVSRAWAQAAPPIPDPNLFVEARKLNRRLPPAQRIRIVLAHPWASGVFRCKHGRACNPWGDGLDRTIADVVEKEVFQRHEHALLLAAYWKLDRRARPTDARGYGVDSAARRIERRHPGSLFLAWAVRVCPSAMTNADDLVHSWRAPALADIRGTSVGFAPETLLWRCVRAPLHGFPIATPSAERHVQDDVDAILKVGR
jgi:hypothetical protein